MLKIEETKEQSNGDSLERSETSNSSEIQPTVDTSKKKKTLTNTEKQENVSKDTTENVSEVKPTVSLEQFKSLEQLNIQKSKEIEELKKSLEAVSQKFSQITEVFSPKKELSPEEKMKLTTDEVSKKTDDVVKQLQEMQNELNKTKLELFKEKHLSTFGGKVIPELIKGNTENEIIESTKQSNLIYEKILKEVEEKLRLSNAEEKSKTKLPGNKVPATERNPLIEDNAKKISGMSLDDYEKNRSEIMKLLKNYV